MTLTSPDSPALWEAARRLVQEYAASLNLDLAFQNFEHEITTLPQEYGPPGGCFVLAEQDGAFIGCGGFRQISDSACEMKRLYVVPDRRATGVGRALAMHLLDRARERGYSAMLLDTLPSMQAAHRLYASLGFKPIPPYRYNPVPGTTFMALVL